MGFLNLFRKNEAQPKLTQLPDGCFTVDARGRVLISTVPQWFPPAQLREIGKRARAAFQSAKQAQMPLNELILHFGALKITARELRGGAIVFLTPKTTESAPATHPTT